MNDSEIKKFFEDQTIFITGGTGFLGKVLIEKLLRTCNVRKIYILMRPKKGKTIQQRIETFISFPCFDRLKAKKENFDKSVEFVDGDCEKINLDISFDMEKVLIDETNVVIHAAANVKFDQPLRQAANINVRATRDILELAKKMPLLKAFVYVSTAYSNCPHNHIAEKFYDPPISAQTFINILDEIDDQVLERITPEFIVPWPNTYTFTKSIAEDLIKTEGRNLPVAIVRPAIVAASFEEPVPGWVDNFYGLMGISLGGGLGVLRSFHAKIDNVCLIVPCDYVANIVLSSAWATAKEKKNNISIYNYVGSKKNFITWRKYVKTIKAFGMDYATEKIVWYSTFKFQENLQWHRICIFFQHTVLAYIADFVLVCIGRQPLAVKNYDRMDKLLSLTSYFTMNYWSFDHDNVDQLWTKMGDSDKKCFIFNMDHLDWTSYINNLVMGIRIYLLKDPLETVPQGRKKLRTVTIAHYTIITIFYLLLLLFFWWIVKQVF